jgi:hypothetical protein
LLLSIRKASIRCIVRSRAERLLWFLFLAPFGRSTALHYPSGGIPGLAPFSLSDEVNSAHHQQDISLLGYILRALDICLKLAKKELNPAASTQPILR